MLSMYKTRKIKHRNKTRKIKHRNKTRKNNKCNIYKSCNHVPCGHTMNKCKPSYCITDPKHKYSKYQSRNWSVCNMVNWGKQYHHYKPRCRDETKCTLLNTPITKYSVDALELHNKFPYIWRFLKPSTKRHIIDIASKSVDEINIPYDIFPEYDNKKEERSIIRNITKKINKKNRKKFFTLRKKYKTI